MPSPEPSLSCGLEAQRLSQWRDRRTELNRAIRQSGQKKLPALRAALSHVELVIDRLEAQR